MINSPVTTDHIIALIFYVLVKNIPVWSCLIDSQQINTIII